MHNFNQFIREFRPELADKTINLYAREMRYLSKAYGIEFFDPMQLYENLKDIALEELNLNHITLEGLTSHKHLRLAVFRNLVDILEHNDDHTDYELLDNLILEAKINLNK